MPVSAALGCFVGLRPPLAGGDFETVWFVAIRFKRFTQSNRQSPCTCPSALQEKVTDLRMYLYSYVS